MDVFMLTKIPLKLTVKKIDDQSIVCEIRLCCPIEHTGWSIHDVFINSCYNCEMNVLWLLIEKIQ